MQLFSYSIVPFAFFLGISAVDQAAHAQEPTVIPLWESGAPGFESRKDEPEEAKDWWVKNIHYPTLTAFLPDPATATGAAAVIVPGGGHRLLVFDGEGTLMAKHLQARGIAAFVLKHRLAREENSPYQIEVHALEDGQRAMRLVRANAKSFGINPSKIGIIGFSAGGEVAMMVSYSNSSNVIHAVDAIDEQSSLPNFQVLIYPGPIGMPETLNKTAPPSFLVVANDDGAAKNILQLMNLYRDAGLPVETHVYASGGHGFNMGQRS